MNTLGSQTSPSDLGELTGLGGTDRLIADQRIYRGRGSEDLFWLDKLSDPRASMGTDTLALTISAVHVIAFHCYVCN